MGYRPIRPLGTTAIRNVWESCLPYFPDEFRSEHRDLQIHVAGDVAIAHGIHHFVPTPRRPSLRSNVDEDFGSVSSC